MKLSLSWIRDYVNIPEDADLKKLAYDLTMSTVEVEDVEYLAERFENMIVGVIEKIEPQISAVMRSKTSYAEALIWKKECALQYLVRERLSAGTARVSL